MLVISTLFILGKTKLSPLNKVAHLEVHSLHVYREGGAMRRCC